MAFGFNGYNLAMKSEEQIKKDWYEFANQAYMDWRGNTRNTITDFAERWVGISQSLMSSQLKLNGVVPRDQKTITAWVNRYGVKIYEILGLPVPLDSIELLPEPVRSVAQEIRETLAEFHTRWNNQDLETQRSILQSIVRKVTVERDGDYVRGMIYFYNPNEEDLLKQNSPDGENCLPTSRCLHGVPFHRQTYCLEYSQLIKHHHVVN